MKKLTTLTILATSALLLAACGNNSSSKDTSSSKDNSAAVSRKKAKSSSKQKAASESQAKAASASKAKAASQAAASAKAQADSESQVAAASASAAASSSAAAASTQAAASATDLAQPLTTQYFEAVEGLIFTADKTFDESQIVQQDQVNNKMGAQSDGSFVIDTSDGAQKLNVYTVIPRPNKQYEVVSQHGTFQSQDSLASWDKVTKTVPSPLSIRQN